ncbi:MAG TPA: efflux RND transporter periplasmic adaptor subunit [Bryobacteraceae bacterium]|nr:efflux RND transporter periplasmic adaptor subunit [Bryobacteraceae bacterium]
MRLRLDPRCLVAAVPLCLALGLGACAKAPSRAAASTTNIVTVGVSPVARKSLDRELTMSSELVPFQEIDVYAKEAGYVRSLMVDYGSRVRAGQVLAVLEIPELEVQLRQDDVAIQNATEQGTRARHELGRVEAQHQVSHLQFKRLSSVASAKPGLVAQQEVDDAQGRDLAAEAQVEAAKSTLESAESQIAAAKARKEHDQVLFDYSKITAPFAGVITQRYANLGTLMQAGTTSSTQAMPLARLSQDDLFRLVIPVPESYVRYIRVGSPVRVNVPSLNRDFPGKVARFSVDVKEDTRTMHTEVDVPNPGRALIPGLYAEATLTLEHRDNAVSIPLQSVDRSGSGESVYIVNPSHQVEERPVTLGLQTASDAEVLSGLSEGDMVIVSDRSGLKPGERVNARTVDPVRFQTGKGEE